MLTAHSDGRRQRLVGSLAVAMVLTFCLAVHQAAARDGQQAFSGFACNVPSSCDMTAGTRKRPQSPVHQQQPATRVPTAPGTHSAGVSSPSAPSDCWLGSLSGTCLATGWQGDPAPPHHGGDQPSAEAVAQMAVRKLQLPSLTVRMSPDAAAAQVVHFPTWLWIAPSDWRPVSQTAEVPGVVVTATATPQRVIWSMGDGGSVTCEGPGTPYSSRFPAGLASPDCGYAYQRSSAGESNESFTVTATVVWDVVWHGAGKGGTVRGLQSVTRVPVRVTEVQAVVVAGRSRI